MYKSKREAHGLAAMLAALSPMMVSAPAFGQTADVKEPAVLQPPQAPKEAPADEPKPAAKPAKRAAAHAPSPNSMVNLVNLLVEQGVLKRNQGQALIKQAESEAFVSRQSAKDASAKADEAARSASVAAAGAAPAGARHVTYVPEIVKRQLREDIKREVMAKAEQENWASPGIFPEWATRIKFYGDTRVRYEGQFFPAGNDQAGAANFNAINTGLPYDVSDANYYGPTYNATEDRNRFRLRTRLGMIADLSNGFEAGMRIATGQDNSPISFNTTLGTGAGNFGKYALWLDRSYLKYNWTDGVTSASAMAGRFDPPFWSSNDLVWWRDIAFDGFAAKASTEFEGFTPFAAGGAFPIYNTDLNAGINLAPTGIPPSKFPSRDRWMFGGQLGFGYKITPETDARVSLAYYDFTNVQGRPSSPCVVITATDVCDTDIDRPLYAQKGNSYTYLRNIIPGAYNLQGTTGQFQYYGLVSEFRPLVAAGQLDLKHFHPVDVTLDGEYVVNTAFNYNLMNAVAVNNRQFGNVGAFNGGNIGWFARMTVGEKDFMHPWGWSVNFGYKYLQSDAVIDSFTDPYFGLGGTNLKGYIIGGNLGISKNVWTSLRWMSADNIGGSQFKSDVFQLDLQARY